jgi:hypothetical protein
MRRFQIPNAALVAGLAVLLSGCSGETPTAPSLNGGNGNGGGNGSCATVILLSVPTQTVTAAIVRATVTRSGQTVLDGGSVQFTTDLGFFGENGLNAISKTIVDGFADVTVFSSSPGTAHVNAVFECAARPLNVQFAGPPTVGPFISSVSPTTSSCAGGDTITILGGRFDGTIEVLFGGVRGSIVGTATATKITVTSPARTLKDPALPETVSLVVSANGVLSPAVSFTYVCILTPVIFSISPTTGPNDTSTRVSIFGTGFQFPMQVFLRGGCTGLVEAQVSDIALTTIVFKTPVADGPNACLANALVDIVIKNPSTNMGFECKGCFRYFSPPVPPTPTLTPTPMPTPTPTPPVPPAIFTTTLPGGADATPYNGSGFTLVATGGTPPYTWAVVSGALPTGLTLSAGGLISGIPSVVGTVTFTFSVRVTDSVGGTATKVLAITIN